jgi:hypothetical protein
MKKIKLRSLYYSMLIVSLFLLSVSCLTFHRNAQLESIARDWSMVVRASQVIPVYPLTEDLQPGDILLVTTPIDDQAKAYGKKGFLPLDQHLYRLDPSADYPEFYRDGMYGIGKGPDSPPGIWFSPAAAGGPTPSPPPDKGNDNRNQAPHASFPSYQFEVDTGSGLSAAIPIQGIPFALGLMNTGKASGSVSFTGAYTYGLDITSLAKKAADWADGQRALLQTYAPSPLGQQYLRVVSRVFLIEGVDVAINNDEATGGNAGVGGSSPIGKLLSAQSGNPSANYSSVVDAVNTMAASQTAPGTSIKITTATSRAVTLKETFTRPLVIGYVGFDLPILQGGRLGGPISTLDQLNGKVARVVSPRFASLDLARLAVLRELYSQTGKTQGADEKAIHDQLDGLAAVLPANYGFVPYILSGDTNLPAPGKNSLTGADFKVGDVVARKSFDDVLDYASYAATTVLTLGHYAKTATSAQYSADLSSAEAELRRISALIMDQPGIAKAADYVILGIVD